MSLRTVRHYHDVGVLPEPVRLTNGYKQYSVSDLVVLLRIRRLSKLGFPLAQISDLLEEGEEREAELVAKLDQELQAEIRRLQLMRDELANSLKQGAPPDVEPGAFLAAARFEKPNQLRLGVLLSIALSAVEQESLVKFVDDHPDGYATLNEQFASLTPTSSEEDINRVADLILEAVLNLTMNEKQDSTLQPSIKGIHPNFAVDLLAETFMEGLNSSQQRALSIVLS
ncbi:MerR family transcriptional regulator [Leucobacter insecticola]|uniref:MerR family transcriptional regulator n=1 Tax=Leucobacter insecticola TaxID=2714934 RepID=A0A6G8FLD2_9MICO|nr:MerR family transcriptional regulator [Leucobacter insecticola]QIM17161.1 MerR family transcriptional regulator [Leucobacter insecticola]